MEERTAIETFFMAIGMSITIVGLPVLAWIAIIRIARYVWRKFHRAKHLEKTEQGEMA